MKENKHKRPSAADIASGVPTKEDFDLLQIVYDAAAHIEDDKTPPKERRQSLPKVALEITKDGIRPDGLTVRTAGRIKYDGKEYILTRAERYVLHLFTYSKDPFGVETMKAQANAKAKFETREELRDFIVLRNKVLTLFKFGLFLYNDVLALALCAEEIKQAIKHKENQREDEEDDFGQTAPQRRQTLFDILRLRVEAELEIIQNWCEEMQVPPYLRTWLVTRSFDLYKNNISQTLFPLFGHTTNSFEIKRTCRLYLDKIFAEQNNF